MKKVFLILILIILGSLSVNAEYGIEEVNLRPSKTISLPKGSFIKLTNIKEFSSQFVDNGDEVILACNYDIYLGETKLIPEKSKFYGYIEEVREPLQGTNAALVIRVTKFITPDGIPYHINGYLTSANGNPYLGGERTPPLYYTRMPHYTKWNLRQRYKDIGFIQYRETNTRMYGVHTVVKPGAEIIMVLDESLDLTQ